MKIFANIPQGAKILNALKIFKKPRKLIYEARARGDFETERKYILESTSTWGKLLCSKLGVEIEVRGESIFQSRVLWCMCQIIRATQTL